MFLIKRRCMCCHVLNGVVNLPVFLFLSFALSKEISLNIKLSRFQNNEGISPNNLAYMW